MFEDYLSDAHYYLIEGNHRKRENIEASIRAYRASVFLSASALEAFINYIGETLDKSADLSLHERDLLNDREHLIKIEAAILVDKTKYFTVESKIKYLIKKFNIDYEVASSSEWSKFQEFRKFRNKLIHPRENVNDFTIDNYKQHSEIGLKVNIFFIDLILNGVIGRPLRKKIKDLADF